MKKFYYIDTDSVQEMSREELKVHLNQIYGTQATKKEAPEPRRRKSDVEEVDEILISSTIVFCIMGALFLILGGLGL